jgi:hypothetical protein
MLVVLPQILTGSSYAKIVFVFQISYGPAIMWGYYKTDRKDIKTTSGEK